MEARRRVPLALAAASLGALLAGAVLRLGNLRAQLLLDDELHLVRAALRMPLAEILVTYQQVDHCIPLTALYRGLVVAGVGLSEMLLRLPALLAGLALLVLAPLWAGRRLGGGTGVALAWLLAISPGLVLYSRIARSYLPMILLCCVAVAALDAWWRRPAWRSGALFAVAAALAVWLHLGAAPLLAAVLLPPAASVVARRGRGARPLLALGAGAALAIAAPLLPARATLLATARAKSGSLELGWSSLEETLRMQAGTTSPLVAALFWTLAGVGWWRLARRDARLASLAVAAAAGQLAGILLLAPAGHALPVVLHRYLLPGLPWVLLGVASALGERWPERWGGWERARPPAFAALAAVLLLTGPFTEAARWRTSFAHHYDWLDFLHPRPTVPAGRLAAFYRTLAEPGRGGAVLEAPWHPFTRLSRSLYLYQEAHRQDVLAASLGGGLAHPGLAMRNMLPPEEEAFLASRARWLIVHRDLGREEARLRVSRVDAQHRDALRRTAAHLAARLEAAWGPPAYRDRTLRAWDLDAVRARLGGGAQAVRAAASPAAASSAAPRKPGGR